MNVRELREALEDLPDYYPVEVQVGYHRAELDRLLLRQDSRPPVEGVVQDPSVFVRLLA